MRKASNSRSVAFIQEIPEKIGIIAIFYECFNQLKCFNDNDIIGVTHMH